MPVGALLEEAARGVEPAWREIVRRYSPLLVSVCHRQGVVGADAEDVGATVWMRLLTRLSTIREPEALPGWLATTTRRECVTLLREKCREVPHQYDGRDEGVPGADVSVLAGERREAVRGALTGLAPQDRRLLSMLFSDPPTPYREISSTLGMPVGAIGPTRQRCLARVRRDRSVAALLDEGHGPRSSGAVRDGVEHIEVDDPGARTANGSSRGRVG